MSEGAKYSRYCSCKIHLLFIFCVYLVFIFLTPGLAIWTIPIEKNDQRDDKNDIWNRDGGDYGANHLARIVSFQNNPGIDAGVVTWKSLIIFVNIWKKRKKYGYILNKDRSEFGTLIMFYKERL